MSRSTASRREVLLEARSARWPIMGETPSQRRHGTSFRSNHESGTTHLPRSPTHEGDEVQVSENLESRRLAGRMGLATPISQTRGRSERPSGAGGLPFRFRESFPKNAIKPAG